MSTRQASLGFGRSLVCCAGLLLLACPAHAQSTEVIVTGRVVDSRTGLPLAGARVRYRNYETGAAGSTETDSRGFYSLPSLPPATYSFRAERQDYQARELQARDVYVGARLEINFTLRPLKEVLEPGDYNSALLPGDRAILPVLGPDLEAGRSAPLEATDVQSESRQPSLSYVINPRQISQAPLSARNVYSMILTLPGVTAAQVTGRGLQISANGQRASASNYLLDGVQNNDFVNTGAFSATAPEAIQEYRISTNNYSAEYGQTSGFIANAVTKSGGNAYHGLAYAYLDNEALDANTPQNNLGSFPRNPFKRTYAGYSATGPILRDRLFFSSAFEQLTSKSFRNPETIYYFLPDRLRACLVATSSPTSSPILALYSQFPLQNPVPSTEHSTDPAGGPCGDFAQGVIRRPVSLNRTLALERLDYQSRDGAQRLMGRLALSRETQPDYVYSIYKGLSESIVRNTASVSLGYVRSFSPSLVNDLRFAWSPGLISAIRPHPEIPVLQVLTTSQLAANPPLSFVTPSASQALDFGMKGSQAEITEGLTWTRGRHVIIAGGGVLLRRPQYLLSYLDQGLICFGAFQALSTTEWTWFFADGQPLYWEMPFSRLDAAAGKLTPSPPSRYSQYSDNQWSAFLQDNVRLTGRLAVNLGVRYESYGALRNVSGPQVFVEPGAGQSIQERIADATLQTESRSAFRPDRNDWAGRFGISYNPWSRTVLRLGYGIFYDRPFDNLFLDARNQSVVEPVGSSTQLLPLLNTAIPLAQSFQSGVYMGIPPFETLPSTFQNNGSWFDGLYQGTQTFDSRIANTYPLELLWIDRNLRTPYVQSWFASLQQQVSNSFQIEVNQSGSLARKLISNDLVNRICSLSCDPTWVSPTNSELREPGRLNSALPDILYRSNSGSSDYMALEALARYRVSYGFFQAAYTYSHSIDNISDPMLSDVFNLAFTNPDTIGEPHGPGIFTRQFDSRADRGSSDFDIRHSLVFYSVWNPPGTRRGGWLRSITRNWTFAQMAGIRSGLPYSIYADYVPVASGQAFLVDARVNVLNPAALNVSQPIPGGKQLVDLSQLSIPQAGQIGNLGRNALKGPGFWNVDLSLMRSFALPRLGESGRVQVGASAFNAFNHSNLGLPSNMFNPSNLGQPNAGAALYGPTENQTQFPAALPLFPTPRRIQLQIKVSF
jgi:hypothetical protein